MSKMSQLHAQIKDSDYDDSGYDQWLEEKKQYDKWEKEDLEYQIKEMEDK